MSGELRAVAATGKTLYAIALNGTYALDTVLGYFDAFGNNPWGNYAIPLTEIGSWGIYAGDLPYTGSGRWWFLIFDQAGGSPANGDALIAEYMQDVGEYGISGSQDVLFAISGISIPSVVDANLIGFGQGNSNYWPNGNKNSLSGNNITVNWSQSLNDDDGTGYVGWMVWFQGTISGYPTIYFSWQTVVTAVSGNTITVAEMPEHDLTYVSFKVYLFPPGFAAGGGGGLTAQEMADAVNNLAPEGSAAAGSLGAKVDDLPITAAFEARTLLSADYTVVSDLPDVSSLALEATSQSILSAVAGSSLGTGARTVTITIDDGTDPLQGARVRLTQGVQTYVGSTNVDGEIVFGVDDATWTVAITKAGYTFTGTTLVVDGDKTPTYSMTAVSFSASDPSQSTGWVYCYDENGDIESGVGIDIQQTATAETDSYAFDTTLRSGVSDANGLVEFTGLWIGATYRARRYNGEWVTVTVPDAASFALPAMLGR